MTRRRPQSTASRAASVLLATLLAASLAATSRAADHALLVGVSEYPALDQDYQLRGPRNDVLLMQEVLIQRGMDPANIRILADGVAGAALPTRAAILKALDALADGLEAGDRLYLHLSGHASQQPNGPNDRDYEPDGRDEVFLPRDVTLWNPEDERIGNGIRDDELGERIGRLTAKGAFVWLVADTCTAGTIERGVPPAEIRYRGIAAALLGMPPTTGLAAGARQSADTWQNPSFNLEIPVSTATVGEPTEPTPLETEPTVGGYVAFYASRAGEPAPEEKFPYGAADARWHGLLTRRLAEALASPQGARAVTYRRLFERVLQRYAGRRSPNPLPNDGPGIDAPVIGIEQVGALATARQWPLVSNPAAQSGLFIPVGRLAQIGVGSRFALLARPDDDTAAALGYADVAEAEDLSARLRPVAAAGKPAPVVAAIPRAAYARLVRQAIDFEVRIARPPLPADASERERAAAELIAGLAAKRPADGIRLHWVPPGAPADIRLGFTPRGRADCPRDPNMAQNRSGRLWISEGDGAIRCRGSLQTHSIDLQHEQQALEGVLVDSVQRIAKVINLIRVAERLDSASGGGLIEEAQRIAAGLHLTALADRLKRLTAPGMVEVNLRILPAQTDQDRGRGPIALRPEGIAAPRAGDRLTLDIANTGDTPVDINIFFINGRYGIRCVVYPGHPCGPMTLDPGESIETIKGTIKADVQGTERFLVIVTEQLPQSLALDLSFLVQPTLELERGREPRRAGDDLLTLFQSAGFGIDGTRGSLSPLSGRASVSIYQWRLDSDRGAER